MTENDNFETEKKKEIERMSKNKRLKDLSAKWLLESCKYKYSYNFTWLGRPIIQYPQDIIAIQEIIWRVKPDLIIESGIARGGSLIFHASMLELLGRDGKVLGIDIDIRQHNRVEIECHPMFKRITMIEGSSIDESVIQKVYDFAKGKKSVMVILDSMHTHDHVLRELEIYSGLVTKDSFLVVLDTVIDDMPKSFFSDRPWGKGNNPKTAVREFLKKNTRFKIATEIENKLLITVAPSGYLKCVKN